MDADDRSAETSRIRAKLFGVLPWRKAKRDSSQMGAIARVCSFASVQTADAWDKRELDTLVRATERLPDRVRQALTLRKVYGHSHEEIADELHMTVDEVRDALEHACRVISEELFQG